MTKDKGRTASNRQLCQRPGSGLHEMFTAMHVIVVEWTLAYPATTGPDHGQISEIAGYVNHHANKVYIVSLIALFLSCDPSSVQTIIVFRPLQALNIQNSSIFGCSNNLEQLLCSVCSMGVK